MGPWRAAALLFLAAVLPFAPAAGDWLVTTDGERLETRGPWEIRGRLIVYTTPEGTLASIRTSRVDLEASEQATTAAAAPARPAAAPLPTEGREAVLVLTDQDVGKAMTAPAATIEQSGEGEGDAQQQVSQSGTASSLVVASYSDTFDAEENQLVVTGQLRNRGRSLLTRFFLSVIAYDEDGSVIGRAEAIVEADVLRPGETTTFRAVFPALSNFGRLAFNTASSGFVTSPGETREEGEEQPTAAPPGPP